MGKHNDRPTVTYVPRQSYTKPNNQAQIAAPSWPPTISPSSAISPAIHHASKQQAPAPNNTKTASKPAKSSRSSQGSKSQQLYPHLDWATKNPSKHGQVYSTLTRNIVDMIEKTTPNDLDIIVRELMVQLIKEAAEAALPAYKELKVQPFGSFVSGLGTHESDLDVVITGVIEPWDEATYSKPERSQVAKLLDHVSRNIRRIPGLTVHNMFIIRHARVPIIKLNAVLDPNQLPPAKRAQLPHSFNARQIEALPVDISMTTDAGPKAAAFVASKSAQYPSLRPLMLSVKAYMKALDLNDVASGGLASFGLTFMMLAHLMEEEKRGSQINDLGWMLHRFFIRYGQDFQPYSQAVSVRDGGVVYKNHVLDLQCTNYDRICCVDPLTGRNCTEGSYRSNEILLALRHAAEILEAKVKQYSKGCPKNLDILQDLINTPLPDDYGYDDEYPYDDNCAFDTANPPPSKRQNTGERYKPQDKPLLQQLYAYTYPDKAQQEMERNDGYGNTFQTADNGFTRNASSSPGKGRYMGAGDSQKSSSARWTETTTYAMPASALSNQHLGVSPLGHAAGLQGSTRHEGNEHSMASGKKRSAQDAFSTHAGSRSIGSASARVTSIPTGNTDILSQLLTSLGPKLVATSSATTR